MKLKEESFTTGNNSIRFKSDTFTKYYAVKILMKVTARLI